MFKDLLGDAFPIIEKVAPVIAGILGSPVEGVAAQYVITALGNAFGIAPKEISHLGDAIVNEPLAQDKLSILESVLPQLFAKNSLKFPSHVEISIKADWDAINSV
jgi:hypothetical protein